MSQANNITSTSHVGRERNHNEDYHLFCPDLSKGKWLESDSVDFYDVSKAGSLLILADGMGGANAGEIASKLSCYTIKDYFLKNLTENILESPHSIRDLLFNAIAEAHNRLLNYQQENPESSGMGTTLVIAWIVKDSAFIAWAGDSRCYLFNKKKGRFTSLTKDHSLVQQYIDEKRISEEMAFNHPQKNIITQSVGGSEDPPEPDFVHYNLRPDDSLLLCSDGLNAMLQDNQIYKLLSEAKDDTQRVHSLIDEANNAGGEDNTTIILYRKNAEQRGFLFSAQNQNFEKNYQQFGKPFPDKKKKFLVTSLKIVLFAAVALILLYIISPFDDKKEPAKSLKETENNESNPSDENTSKDKKKEEGSDDDHKKPRENEKANDTEKNVTKEPEQDDSSDNENVEAEEKEEKSPENTDQENKDQDTLSNKNGYDSTHIQERQSGAEPIPPGEINMN